MIRMQRNNFLIQTQKNNQSVFWKKKTNNHKLDLTRKVPQQNPVYRALKFQRDSNTILAFILGESISQKSPSKHIRSKSYEIQRYGSNSKQTKQLQTFREKAVNIMFKAKKMSEEMECSKKKFKILNKFNKTVQKYYSNRPQGQQEEDQALAESIMVNNQQLMKVYNEELLLSQSLKKRASSCIKYKQPKIPRDKMQKLKEKVKLILNVTPKAKNKSTLRLLTTHE